MTDINHGTPIEYDRAGDPIPQIPGIENLQTRIRLSWNAILWLFFSPWPPDQVIDGLTQMRK